MLRRLPLVARLPLIFALLLANTVVHVGVLFIVTAAKLLSTGRWRRRCGEMSASIAERWIAVNSALIERFSGTRINVRGDFDKLKRLGSYLVLSNHQSWVDIPVLHYVFNRRVPLLRFFLKKELIWVPLLGPAWWALDFPFMKRYSKETLARRPELAGTDIDATRRACEKFREIPVSVMNFVEGTRFTPDKHARQPSPHLHLLRPKAGGVAFVLDAMGTVLRGIIDVTIVYPAGRPGLMDLLCDRIPEVRISVIERLIPAELIGADYEADPVYRERFQTWINMVWTEKDDEFARLLRGESPAAS
jgi:1-acyl-sn-glycerol-3-phosphate acyltransferase